MDWNKHSALVGHHAVLSASKPHWLEYDDDKFDRWFFQQEQAARGTRLHTLAHDLIREGVKLPDSNRTLHMYVNDAIGYRMTPEQLLFYSIHCFGTADAISFSERKKKLRISDLKTGVTTVNFNQLIVYAALFFLEYGLIGGFRPSDFSTELRIYQNDEIKLHMADPVAIMAAMDRIITLDRRITALRGEA